MAFLETALTIENLAWELLGVCDNQEHILKQRARVALKTEKEPLFK